MSRPGDESGDAETGGPAPGDCPEQLDFLVRNFDGPANSWPWGVTFVDADGQDPLDVAVGAGLGLAWTHVGVEGGYLYNPSIIFDNHDKQPQEIASADFDGDGHADLLATDHDAQSQQMHVFWGDGAGSFVHDEWIMIGDYPWRFSIADYDGDGNLDFAVQRFFDLPDEGDVIVVYGQGDRSWLLDSPAVYDGRTKAMAGGDFDDDGTPDLVIADSTGEVHLLLGNDSGFELVSSLGTVTGESIEFHAGDLDGLGGDDLVITTRTLLDQIEGTEEGELQIWLSGEGQIEGSSFSFAASDGFGLDSGHIADINGDGLNDVVAAVADGADSHLWVQIQTLEGFGECEHRIELAGDARRVDSADFDGDGDLDLVAGSGHSRVALVLQGEA